MEGVVSLCVTEIKLQKKKAAVVAGSEHAQVCADKGTMRTVSARQMHRIKRAAAKMKLQSSKWVFEAADVSEFHERQGGGSSGGLQLCINSHPLSNARKQKRLQSPQETHEDGN